MADKKTKKEYAAPSLKVVPLHVEERLMKCGLASGGPGKCGISPNAS